MLSFIPSRTHPLSHSPVVAAKHQEIEAGSFSRKLTGLCHAAPADAIIFGLLLRQFSVIVTRKQNYFVRIVAFNPQICSHTVMCPSSSSPQQTPPRHWTPPNLAIASLFLFVLKLTFPTQQQKSILASILGWSKQYFLPFWCCRWTGMSELFLVSFQTSLSRFQLISSLTHSGSRQFSLVSGSS